MTNPKFTVITPVYIYNQWRARMLVRAINSVLTQTVEDFEYIIVNDGSTIQDIELPQDKRIIQINQPHQERLIAYNAALEQSLGEWICFLDSDDEYVSYYLEAVSAMIEKFPDSKMFNFGSLHAFIDYSMQVRGPFKPPKKEVGHEIFGGGTIVNGTYVFHRSIYEELGAYPHTSSPWDFSTMAQEEFPEIKPMFMVDHPDHPEKIPKELGNPWGQDYYLFYKYTRKFHSEPIDAHLYLVHPSRKEHKL